MAAPVAEDNTFFWARSEPESVTTKSHRPHVVKGTKQCTPKAAKHNSKRRSAVLIIRCHRQSYTV